MLSTEDTRVILSIKISVTIQLVHYCHKVALVSLFSANIQKKTLAAASMENFEKINGLHLI